jgi:cobalt-zinc-cadmium efflux system protein
MSHSHAEHSHQHRLQSSSWRLSLAFWTQCLFFVVELVGGILTNSLALLADAGHMLTDVLALGLAIFVAHLAERPATPGRTFGFLRAEVIGAFLNGATLILIVALVYWEAARRFLHPTAVAGAGMLGIAIAGLVANVGSAAVLHGSRRENINVEGAFLHMVADALGSVGAVVAGIVILLTGWMPVDPLVSILIGGLVLWSGIGLLRRTLAILIQGTPAHLDFLEIQAALRAHPYVLVVLDLHIWQVTSGFPVLTAEIWLKPDCTDPLCWQQCLGDLRQMLRERFGIEHATLQLEPTILQPVVRPRDSSQG